MNGNESPSGLRPAWQCVQSVRDRLGYDYVYLHKILGHVSVKKDYVLMATLVRSLASLDEVGRQLDDYLEYRADGKWTGPDRPWTVERPGVGKESISTGTTDIPAPHDGGGSGGG